MYCVGTTGERKDDVDGGGGGGAHPPLSRCKFGGENLAELLLAPF